MFEKIISYERTIVMNFIEELEWRNIIHDMTPGIEEVLKEKKIVGYIGFDPTAPSLTIGNFIQIQLLNLFQRHGHTPIVLMGGATGRIGDPSFKKDERILMSNDEIEHNLQFQVVQMKKFLNFESNKNAAILVNNIDFYHNMNVLDFLRDVGKNLTVNYMMGKDSVKSRLKTGISFTEFSYQLLQANDFLEVYKKYNCVLQMGGSDQWGNITSGTEFIRRNITGGKAYAITTPLLTKSDGTKFGKSEGGNIWLDPNMTSPYKFYQFWVNANDEDIISFYKYFTLHSKEEAEANIQLGVSDPRQLKAILSRELTTRIHSVDEYEVAKEVSEVLFNNKFDNEALRKLRKETLSKISSEIPSYTIDKLNIAQKLNIVALVTEHTDILQSNSEVRRAIKSNALAINKIKVDSHDFKIERSHLIHEKFILLENGKKNKFIIECI